MPYVMRNAAALGDATKSDRVSTRREREETRLLVAGYSDDLRHLDDDLLQFRQ
jgi:hypothetical protein